MSHVDKVSMSLLISGFVIQKLKRNNFGQTFARLTNIFLKGSLLDSHRDLGANRAPCWPKLLSPLEGPSVSQSFARTSWSNTKVHKNTEEQD